MLTITADFRKLERAIDNMRDKQIPFAMMMAVNDAAKDALNEVNKDITRSFANPTPWTKNAFYIKKARYSGSAKSIDPKATIERKSAQRGRHYLETQYKGGARPQTGMERLLSHRLKYSGIVRTITPAKGARRNKYGNMSPGQRNQILSSIKGQRDATANTTTGSRRRNKTRAGYFAPRPGSKPSPGIYQRMARGRVKKVGQRLRVHLYDDRIEAFLGGTLVVTHPRARGRDNGQRVHVINYHHVIHALKRKPFRQRRTCGSTGPVEFDLPRQPVPPD